MRLVLFGAPGSGKGTEGALLSTEFGIPHIATGAMIRDHIARKTPFGRSVEEAIANGNFAPDEDMLAMIGERLAEDDARRGYILDGFPRDLHQGEAFEAMLPGGEPAVDVAVELIVDHTVVAARVEGRRICPVCGTTYHLVTKPPKVAGICDLDGAELKVRPDDAPESIRRRFEIYDEVTLPLRGFYQAAGRYEGVDGNGTPEEVLHRILAGLRVRLPLRFTENGVARVK